MSDRLIGLFGIATISVGGAFVLYAVIYSMPRVLKIMMEVPQ